MAKITKQKPDPTKGSQKETPIEGNKPEGLSFSDLIKFATGSEAPTSQEFESSMAARGYRQKDVRKLTKAFDQVTQSGKDYFLRDDGFDVYEGGQRETGSGRAKGNKRGADLGDLIGLGGDVSLLAGALRNEKGGYDQKQAQKQQTAEATGKAQGADISKAITAGVNPLANFAMTMSDLIKASGGQTASEQAQKGEQKSGQKTGQKGGQKSGQKQQNGQQQPAGQGFVPDNSILNWSPQEINLNPFNDGSGRNAFSDSFDQLMNQQGGAGQQVEGGEEQVSNAPLTKEQKMAEAEKRSSFFNEDGTFNPQSLDLSNLADPYVWADATEDVKNMFSLSGSSFAAAGPFVKNPALAKVYNRFALPLQAISTGADWVADSMTDEGITGDEMLGDAGVLAANTFGANAGRFFGGKKPGLEQQMRQNARALRPSTKFSLSWPTNMANKISFPAVQQTEQALAPNMLRNYKPLATQFGLSEEALAPSTLRTYQTLAPKIGLRMGGKLNVNC